MQSSLAAQIILVSAATGIVALGYKDTRRLRKEGGLLLRRERRRVILGTVAATGMLLWGAMCIGIARPGSSRTIEVASAAAMLWPLALMAMDLWVLRHHVPTQEDMVARASFTQASGNWIIGAIFAAGLLLSVLNRTPNGHLPASARIMLLGMLAIVALLVPTHAHDPTSDLAWAIYGTQRTVLHMSIGMFVVATIVAWGTAAPAAAGPSPPVAMLPPLMRT